MTTLYSKMGMKVKLLKINPGSRTSLQYHRDKREDMYVVSGTPLIELGLHSTDVESNAHVRIGFGVYHRITNIGLSPLEIIEVSTTMSGNEPDEQDIVRVRDDYGRES